MDLQICHVVPPDYGPQISYADTLCQYKRGQMLNKS